MFRVFRVIDHRWPELHGNSENFMSIAGCRLERAHAWIPARRGYPFSGYNNGPMLKQLSVRSR